MVFTLESLYIYSRTEHFECMLNFCNHFGCILLPFITTVYRWKVHCPDPSNSLNRGQAHDQKVTGLSPGRSGERSFFCSQISALTYFSISSTPMLPQWHMKNPSHSAKSVGGRLMLNTHASYICGFAWSNMTWCMVVWCTQKCAKMAAVSTWHQPNSSARTSLQWICKMYYEKLQVAI